MSALRHPRTVALNLDKAASSSVSVRADSQPAPTSTLVLWPWSVEEGRVDKPRFNRRQLAFLIGVPLAWAVVLLFHPAPDPQNLLESLRGGTTRWLIVHFATLLFIGLMGVVLHLLLSGMTGPAARVASGRPACRSEVSW